MKFLFGALIALVLSFGSAQAVVIYTFNSYGNSTPFTAQVITETDSSSFRILGSNSLPVMMVPGFGNPGVGTATTTGNATNLVSATGYTLGFREIVFNTLGGLVQNLLVKGMSMDYSILCGVNGKCEGLLVSDGPGNCTGRHPCHIRADYTVTNTNPPTPVPEPSTMAIMIMALAAFGTVAHRRRPRNNNAA